VSSLPSVCILAGGLGTRLGARVTDTPKPLLEVAGEPFALHQLRLLAQHGASHVVLCVGYRGEQIEQRIGLEQFGIRIDYSYDGPGLDGTLGAIRRAWPLLPERFLVLYGDTYLQLDYRDAVEAWDRSSCLGLMTVFRNEGRWDTSNVVYENERVVSYDKAEPTPQMRWIDYGLGGLDVAALDLVDPTESDLSSLQGRLARRGQLFGYQATERFYEIGTPEGLAETDSFLSGLKSP
jgi:NDP-sugar pyrophosphorylase family protein